MTFLLRQLHRAQSKGALALPSVGAIALSCGIQTQEPRPALRDFDALPCRNQILVTAHVALDCIIASHIVDHPSHLLSRAW